MNEEFVSKILIEHSEHLKRQAYKSYDLCDITSQPYFLKIDQWCYGKLFGKYIKYPHNILLKHFTSTLRALYGVGKKDFAQSNAFIVRGLLRMYEYSKEKVYQKQANELINRILDQKSTGFKHSAWGQPYDWFSKKIIPANTPRTTVTSQVGKMFLDAYSITKDSRHLVRAIDVGNFFLNEMPLSHDQNEKTCFAYTTIDQHQVHNPNMMAAGFLATLFHFTKEEKYAKRALTSANFTFSEINDNGSWYYAKLPNNQPSKIDNYHTGYNIEGAFLIQKYLKEKFSFQYEFKKSIEYYENQLFSSRGVPFLTNLKKYPIDIQCCAQSIITKILLSEINESYLNQAHELFKWTVDNMYADGSYYYRILKNGAKDKTAYVRWGDAWMLFAASLLLTIKND
ncbi:glycoside hydrolase family 88 protein [Ekhidna sp.]|uniref:glycoside hydrolase family 88 protein n=1 Tax=Ekhidna sp. TaxID=2608089 RepID=UPI003B50B1AB